ncbi:MAG: adenylate kinase [Bacillota bacterium]|nr:adenylate kinase [Bacillota bacterium]
MQLILLGPPGSGKGTLAKDLAELYQVPHISTGDIFRKNIAGKTELGCEVETFIKRGALVPDELTIAMVSDRLDQEDCAKGFLLDGFPRTIPQAEALQTMPPVRRLPIVAVINLQVGDATILRRLSGRRHCSGCGRSYNIVSIPPKTPGICDACGEPLVQRADDREETIIKRLQTYKQQTEPLISYYRKQQLLIDIDNEGSIQACFESVRDKLSDWPARTGL